MTQTQIPLTPREMALAALQDMDVDNELTPEGILQALDCGRITGYGKIEAKHPDGIRKFSVIKEHWKEWGQGVDDDFFVTWDELRLLSAMWNISFPSLLNQLEPNTKGKQNDN